MKYAVLSDIHANLEALQAVLAQVDGAGVDQVVCLGDVVGYHAEPNECVALLRERRALCISGNHDLAALGQKDTALFGEAARRAIAWTAERLTPESRRYLGELPPLLRLEGAFLMVHAALHPQPNPDLHLSSPTRVGGSLDALRGGGHGERVCLFGHTHHAAVYTGHGGQVLRRTGSEHRLEPEGHYLINPGSVGQPRDGDLRAAYALFEVDGAGLSTVRLCRAEYDRAACLRKAEAAGLLYRDGALRRSRHWLRERVQDGKERLRRRLRAW